jgi:hypothetical protein
MSRNLPDSLVQSAVQTPEVSATPSFTTFQDLALPPIFNRISVQQGGLSADTFGINR